MNTVPPFVSIICATYNHAAFISRCLDSFIMQKVDFPIEIIIHDDASTDGTADIIRKYEEKYSEIIKPIYQTVNKYQKGINIASEFIANKIKGKYVTFCEGDDYWIDDCFLKRGIELLENSEEYCCYACNSIYSSSDSQKTATEIQNMEYNQIGHEITFDNYIYLHNSARIFRNILNFDVFFKYTMGGEIFNWWTYLDIGKVYFDHKIASVYNITGKGEWSKLSQKQQQKSLYNCCMLATILLINKYPKFFYEMLPKTKLHKALHKVFGTKLTMDILSFYEIKINGRKKYSNILHNELKASYTK